MTHRDSRWRPSAAPAPAPDAVQADAPASLDRLAQALSEAGVSSQWLTCGREKATGRALVTDAHRLGQALAAAGHQARTLARAAPEAEPLLAVASETSPEALAGLGIELARGSLGPTPAWLALETAVTDPGPLLEALEPKKLFLAEGRMTLRTGGAKRRFDLYRAPRRDSQALEPAPYPEKLGEGPGHLNGRADYFQKRSGSDESRRRG